MRYKAMKGTRWARLVLNYGSLDVSCLQDNAEGRVWLKWGFMQMSAGCSSDLQERSAGQVLSPPTNNPVLSLVNGHCHRY
ncbi:hypothetical protein E2C01_084427 [Portunus trituberculatus]|uniref:Uncharacterized protein n=1 Tax=Portunus trituberculatus TaxID=210409 RepID=A0A5B7J693_PORTR|nr:hypothetical protein [Portunus trituberculatus]